MRPRRREMRTMEEVSAPLRKRLADSGDPLDRFVQAFRIPTDRMVLRVEGDVLVLKTRDRTLRLAYRGMEGTMAGWLGRNGMEGIRRVRWSAE